jgi:hypothetical protein
MATDASTSNLTALSAGAILKTGTSSGIAAEVMAETKIQRIANRMRSSHVFLRMRTQKKPSQKADIGQDSQKTNRNNAAYYQTPPL